MDKQTLEQLYLKEHLTYQQIGDRYGFTRQYVYKLIKQFGIDKSTGERFDVQCDQCGNTYSICRKRFKTQTKHFCSMSCRNAYLHSPGFKQSRYGGMQARKIMARAIGRPLTVKEVVHHIDGNQDNNDLSNLLLFSSQTDHMKYHRAQKAGILAGVIAFKPQYGAGPLVVNL